MKSISLHPLINPVVKTIEIPGSKSYTNRALLMAALTQKDVKVINPLLSDDTKAMMDSLTKLGVSIDISNSTVKVSGSILNAGDKDHYIDTNLAATAIRFLLPVLCIIPGIKILKGKAGLNKRPIANLVDALRELGASIDYTEKEGYPPLRINSTALNPGEIELDGGVSSQFFSALFMIAPIIGGLTIKVKGKQISKPYIDMTIDCMKKFGVDVVNKNYIEYEILPDQKYNVDKYKVEGDFSSASYFFAIAALTKSTITLKNLNPNSVQADKKILAVLSEMGNIITFGTDEITIDGSGVKPTIVNLVDFPDQAQTLAVLTSFAKGKTLLTGLQSLHIKETDRIKSTEEGLEKMGISTSSAFDTLALQGGDPKPASIDTFGDQRTAMAFAIAGARISGMMIQDPDVVNKTFPEFWEKLNELGIKTEVLGEKNIVLTGMRGSGKSTIARSLAKKLDKQYLDLDDLLAEKVGLKIPEIVSSYGWDFFRDKEEEVVKEISGKTNAIISTGGGVVLRKANIAALKKNGTFVFLYAPIDTLLKRIGNDKIRAPLTHNKTREEEMNIIWKDRKNLYQQTADLVVDTSTKTNNEVVIDILKNLNL